MRLGAVATALVFVLVAMVACRDRETKSPPGGGVVPATKPNTSNSLVPNAEKVLLDLVALETGADVTCWTSFRQLDWFIAEKTYSEFGTLAKTRAAKALVRALWAKAAKTAQAANKELVTARDIEGAVSLPEVSVSAEQKQKLESFANGVGIQNFTDYQKTAEHLRIVLSVIHDEIYFGGQDALQPMNDDALVALADRATILSLLLLKESGVRAKDAKAQFIEGEHVQQAYSKLSKDLALSILARKPSPLDPKLVVKWLRPLTRKLIEGKVSALRSFNQGDSNVLSDLNRVSRLPLEPQALQLFMVDLQSFAHFVASGFDPMRSDNYLSDGAFATAELPVRAYLDDVHVQNVMTELFPHEIQTNGDVLIKLVGNPGPMKRHDQPPIELRLLDHEMNGVRDSAVHWLVLKTVFSEKAFAIDPFAAEYFSEVLSMMMTLWIRRAETIAKDLGKTTIDAEVAKRARDRNYVMVPPRDPPSPGWTAERKARKVEVFKSAPYGAPRKKMFNDVTARSGLPQTLDLEDKAQQGGFNIQTIMGGGIAIGDINSDGYPDLFLNGEGLGRLYINRGKAAPLSFEDKTDAYGIPGPINDGHGALLFDMEGDGDLDLIVLRGENPSLIMEQRDGRLFDVSDKVGIKTGKGAHVATAFDYDGDGDLDLYIGYYGNAKVNAGASGRSLPSLDGRNGTANQLWQRQADGTYLEVGARAGVADIGWTLAVAAFDHDMDGDLDLYLANDFGPNTMFENNGDGSFTDITAKTHTGDRGSGMNVDMTDINGDGRWDFYVTNIDMFSKRIKVVFPRDESTVDIDQSLVQAFQYLNGNKLYESQPNDKARPYISSENERFEPGDRGWGWDAAFFDWDNDGDDDLYVANGWIDGSYAGSQKNQLFIVDDGYFYLGPPGSPEAFMGNTRSVVVADFDRDGDMDIICNNFRAPPVVLENPFSGYNGWIELKLVSPAPNSQSVGALVTIKSGGKKILRQVMTGRGYISQADTIIHAGVGNVSNKVDVEVRWPDGTVTNIKGLATNKLHTIEKPGR